jgi:hypothetical protein
VSQLRSPSVYQEWWQRWRRVLRLVVLVPLLAGCPNGAGTPVTGPASGQCTSGIPPVSSVTTPATTCRVNALALQMALPKAKLSPIEIDLYIQDDITCGTSGVSVLCGVDDNRPYVNQISPDPHADPSRNRIHVILDYAAGTLTFRISPSCRIHPANVGPLPVGWNGQKECFAPKQTNEGTSLSVTTDTTNPKAWVTKISSVAVQTNYPAVFGFIEPGQIHNDWTIIIDPTTGTYHLLGLGTDFPDFALISNNLVECSDQATHITGMMLGNFRPYNCNGSTTVIGQPTPTTTPKSTPTGIEDYACPASTFLALAQGKYGASVAAVGPPKCAGGYAEETFTPSPGGQQSPFFFKEISPGQWTLIEGGDAVPTTACATMPASVMTQLGGFSCPTPSATPPTTPSNSVTAGHATPQGAVYGLYRSELAGNWSVTNGACSYVQPDAQSICASSTGGTATGTFSVHSAMIQGTEALVEVTGRICAPSSPCVSNSDPASGMPSAATFSQVYSNLVTSQATIMSPAPAIQVGGQWYVNVGG